MDGPGGAIDHRLAEVGARFVRGGEVSDVLGGEVGVQAGDEHGGAHHLGEAGGVVLQGIAGRRDIGRVELERPGPRDEKIGGVRQRGRTRRGRRWAHSREYTEVGEAVVTLMVQFRFDRSTAALI